MTRWVYLRDRQGFASVHAEPPLTEDTERALRALVWDLGTNLEHVREHLEVWAQVMAGRLTNAGGEETILTVEGGRAILQSVFDSWPDVSFPVLEMDQMLQGYLDWVETLNAQF